LDEKPNEACAFLFNNNEKVVKANPAIKSIASFDDIDPLWVDGMTSLYGCPSALFHSHPCEAFISGKDYVHMTITTAVWNCIWLVMSDRYDLKAFKMENGNVNEIEVEIIE